MPVDPTLQALLDIVNEMDMDPTMIHGFFSMGTTVEVANEALTDAAADVRAALS